VGFFNKDSKLRELERAYLNLIEPTNSIQTFSTEKESIDWLLLGSREDIECSLQAFEEAEEYSWCTVIQRVLREL